MVDDTGKQFVYKNGHAFEDGDSNVDGIRKAKMIQDGTLIERDHYYNENARPGTSSSRTESIQEDPYSLRRSRSTLSTATGGEERSRSKSKSRLFGGGKKSKKDRHERTENAMGGAGHVFDDEFDRELQAGSRSNSHSASAAQAGGFSEPSQPRYSRPRDFSLDDEGPEDADMSVAKQYTGRAPTQSTRSRNDFQNETPPPVPKSKPPRDVMDINHEF